MVRLYGKSCQQDSYKFEYINLDGLQPWCNFFSLDAFLSLFQEYEIDLDLGQLVKDIVHPDSHNVSEEEPIHPEHRPQAGDEEELLLEDSRQGSLMGTISTSSLADPLPRSCQDEDPGPQHAL